MLPDHDPNNNTGNNLPSETSSALNRVNAGPPAEASSTQEVPRQGRMRLIAPERRRRKPRTPKPEIAPTPAPATPSTAPPATMTSAEKTMSISNLARLRLAQNFGEQALVEKVITIVPVRKPARNEFFRIRPGDNWRTQTAMLVIEGDQGKEMYFVDPSLRMDLVENIRPVELDLAISKGGGIFLLPINLPDETGRWNLWSRSLSEAAKLAESFWIKLIADRSQNMYVSCKALGEIPEPVWPDLTLEAIFDLALKDKLITTSTHPILRKIRGEI